MVARVVFIFPESQTLIFIANGGNSKEDRNAEGHFLKSKTALIKKEELETKIQTKDTQSAWRCVNFRWHFGAFREVSFVFSVLFC